MEGDIQEGVEVFIRSRHFERLRKPPATFSERGPSDRIVSFLAGDSSTMGSVSR
jgi:hypothetical protein